MPRLTSKLTNSVLFKEIQNRSILIRILIPELSLTMIHRLHIRFIEEVNLSLKNFVRNYIERYTNEDI